MSKKKIKAEILDLREKLSHYNYLYYVEGESSISDREFDRMLDHLIDLEEKHPEFEDPNSPSKRVGGSTVDAFETVKHAVPMLSMDKSYSTKDIKNWLTRIGKLLPSKEFDYYVDPKIDGLAVGLRYEDGEFVQGVTRGDGEQGDDITNNLRAIASVPLRLQKSKEYPIPKVLEVRGEVFMTRPVFDKLNAELALAGEKLHKNPRNLSSGTLKSHDNSVVAARRLSFCMHGVGEIEGNLWEEHSDFVKASAAWGLPQSSLAKLFGSIEGVMEYLENFEQIRRTMDYDTDGVVIRVNRYEDQEKLGETTKAPRWAIAFKYATEQIETVLLSVDFKMGKRGVITPRGNMEPVDLGGSTIQHASLHNFDEVARKDIRVGDRVIIEKAGEIIPYIVCSLPAHRTGDEEPILPPEACPSCGSDTIKKEGEAILRCSNYLSCPGSLVKALRHFSGRRAMDIDGLGKKLIQQIVDMELVSRFDGLYALEEEELLKLDRVGKKSAQKLLNAVEKSKTRGLGYLLNSICIPGVGEVGSKLLAKTYGSMDTLAATSEEELAQTEGIGEVVAEGIVEWFADPRSQDLLEALKEHGVLMEQATSAPKASTKVVQQEGEGEIYPNILEGMSVVVTGKLTRRSRDEVNELIEAAGGKAAGSVSKKIDLLVCGEKAGSKLAKAEKLGIEVISEDDFYVRIGLEGRDKVLEGLTIVVTGKMIEFSRDEVNEMIESAGGKSSGSVSKKTDLLVYGEKAGSKLAKAEKLGVEAITEEEFYARFGL